LPGRLVRVENGRIIKEISFLVQSPDNYYYYYWDRFTRGAKYEKMVFLESCKKSKSMTLLGMTGKFLKLETKR